MAEVTISKYEDGYCPAGQALLMPDVLVSRYKYFKAFGLCRTKQSAVFQRLPSARSTASTQHDL